MATTWDQRFFNPTPGRPAEKGLSNIFAGLNQLGGAIGTGVYRTPGKIGDWFRSVRDAGIPQTTSNAKLIRQILAMPTTPSANPTDDYIKATYPKGRADALGELSRGKLTGVTPQGGLNITAAGGGDYTGVSPEFARTAGAISADAEKQYANTLAPLRNQAAQAAQKQITQNAINANQLYTNSLIAARTVPTQPQRVGMSREESMERYGTSFPDQLPMNPTWRDVNNMKDYNIRSRLVPTANPNVGAGAAASAGMVPQT